MDGDRKREIEEKLHECVERKPMDVVIATTGVLVPGLGRVLAEYVPHERSKELLDRCKKLVVRERYPWGLSTIKYSNCFVYCWPRRCKPPRESIKDLSLVVEHLASLRLRIDAFAIGMVR